MKKKLNRKPAYKKGGESWVSDKMANLPMYQMGTQTTLPNTLGFKQSPMNLQPQLNKLDPNSLNYGNTWANNNPLPQMGNNGFSYNPNLVGDLNDLPSSVLQQNQETYVPNNTNTDTTQPEKFFNPYGGLDIESRLAYGANQLGKGNTAQGILGLASGALGIARTGVGAYAAGNRERYVMDEYNDNVNKAMTPRYMSLEEGGMIDFMQNGGYNYTPTGDRNINKIDAQKINQATGIQFTPDFAQSYFSQQSQPQVNTVPQTTPVKNTNVLDITSNGQFTDRKVWRNQVPSWYVGKKEPVEGVDYDVIPYKQWNNYKMTSEYNKFQNQNRDSRVAEYQEGGQTGQDQVMQIIQMYAQMSQQDPQAIMEQLQQMSPEEQQMAIQEMAQALQQPQQEQQFQKGGEFAKKLTGEYTAPLDENDPTINAEVERDEYLQSPDGEISKALGETHESGGTKVNLEPGTRIVSDHLKLGGDNAKHYKQNFDLEVKATDTYAKVLDKFTQKSGLQKIVDEQEKVIEQLRKSEESAQGSSVSESTNNLNKMFLSEKLAELEQEKAPLLEARKALMEDVFNRQEASKPEEEISEEQFQTGGEYINFYKDYINSPNYKKRLVMQGYKNPNTTINQRNSNVTSTKLTNKEGFGSQYFPSNKTVNIDNSQLKTQKLPKDSTTAHEYSHVAGSMMLGYNGVINPNLTLNNREMTILNSKNQYNNIDTSYNSNLSIDKKIEIDHDKLPGEAKANIDTLRYKLKKDGVYDTGTQEFNQKTLDKAKKLYSKDPIINRNFKAFKDKDLIYIMNSIAMNENDFNNIQYAKEGGEIPRYQNGKNQDRFDDWYASLEANGYTGKRELNEARAWQEKNDPQSVISYYTTSGQPFTAKHIDMAKSQFKDAFSSAGIPLTKNSASLTPQEAKRLQEAIGDRLTPEFILEGHNDRKQDWRAPLASFQMEKPVGITPQQISAPKLPNFYREPENTAIPKDTEVGKIKEQQEDTRQRLNLMMLPNQSPMMPDSLEGALKVTRRYDRVNPMQFSPEQQVGAIRGQEAQAIEQINQLPESQRAGALANLSAITQENLAKVYSDINRANLASDNQAQQFNAQTQAQEENARVADLQSYENKIMRAKATTDADRRGYYNQLQAIGLANYNSINNVNLLNQMYDNYGYNGSSVEQTQGAPIFSASQATANGIPITNTKKKTTKKRFGGKI